MAQPLLYQIKSWDAKNDGEISFSYSGNQVFKNQLIIKNNITNITVYDQTQTSFQLKHIISANTLQNNICYNVQIRVFNKDDVPSAWSQIQIFFCFDTPIFAFSTITDGQTIQNSAISAELIYDQLVDPINMYQFFLYSEQKVVLNKSQTMYGSSMRYVYTGLEDKNKYFIRATGETLNHIQLDTGYVGVSVQYVVPALYAIVDLTNIYNQGLIRIHSNIVSIEGKSNPSPPVFVNNMIDVTSKDSWVLFDEGYTVNGDFTLQLDARSLIQNKQTLLLKENNNSYIEIKYMLGQKESANGNSGHFILRAHSNSHVYTQISNYISNSINSPLFANLWVRRINHVYEIKVAVNEVR